MKHTKFCNIASCLLLINQECVMYVVNMYICDQVLKSLPSIATQETNKINTKLEIRLCLACGSELEGGKFGYFNYFTHVWMVCFTKFGPIKQ